MVIPSREDDFQKLISTLFQILVPNIPVQNGVAHIIDNVLGVVTNTIDQVNISQR